MLNYELFISLLLILPLENPCARYVRITHYFLTKEEIIFTEYRKADHSPKFPQVRGIFSGYRKNLIISSAAFS